MRRRHISYRISLVIFLPLLVLLTGGAIALRTFITTRATVDGLADDLFRTVAAQAEAQTRSEILRAAPSVELLRSLREYGAADDREVVLRQFLAVLKANPGFSWVSYSDEAGRFVGVHHTAGGVFRDNQSEIADGKTHLVERDLMPDGTWKTFRDVPDSGYDPRTRPFYTSAARVKKRVFTPPYVFFEQSVPGITCALPHLGKDDRVLGVLTVDFDLNSLSSIVGKLKPSEHGRVFLFTGDGALIAHPTVALVEQSGHGAEGKLLRLGDVDDPVVHAFEGRREAGAFSFRIGDEVFRGSVTPFRVDEGLDWFVAVAAPESDFMAGVRRNNTISLLVSLAALGVAIGIALVLANRVARPLAAIAGDMDDVGRLDLRDKPSEPSAFLEIARMDDALRRMKTSISSFARYVPRDVVRALLRSGGEAKLAGEVKTLTVFFSDIAGFTTLAETMAPDALVELLGGYFDESTRVLAEKRGTVDKFIGDGIMAFWGAPEELPGGPNEHAALACEACLLYQRRIEEARRAGEPWAEKVSVRIGLATGPALVGNIGSHERMNYTVMGDTVNLAARLEGLCKAYGVGILVAEATYVLARERVVGRPVDVVAVKGKALGTKVYELLAPRGSADTKILHIEALAEEAFAAYLARDFSKCVAKLGEVLAERPSDTAAAVLKERAEEYEKNPPPPEWSGVHVAKEK